MIPDLTKFQKDRVARHAKRITYQAVNRALQDARSPQEGVRTVKGMLSKVSRRTRKEIEKDVLNPYKQRHSL